MIQQHNKTLVCDTESYPNYFLIAFKIVNHNDYYLFETTSEFSFEEQCQITSILRSNTIVTFNGIKYDSLMIDCALCPQNGNVKTINLISHSIIKNNDMPWVIRKKFNLYENKYDHVDLIEVAPGKGSLKLYGGRLHCPKLQDLPIDPLKSVNNKEQKLLKKYCKNDLDTTEALFLNLAPQINLRKLLGKDYQLDLRSKSDAQIAECIIKSELENEYNLTIKRTSHKSAIEYYYKTPLAINFTAPILNNVLKEFQSNRFVADDGEIKFNFTIADSDKNKKGELPKEKRKLKFKYGHLNYTVGLGGLHSVEKSISHIKQSDEVIREYDVSSYYPTIVLNNKIYPEALGKKFLIVYKNIVDQRLLAKKTNDHTTSEALKIAINGTFGKLGSKWSYLYSPQLLTQITITGQLTLLTLIEELESNGIEVISANTDGIFIKTKNIKPCDKIIEDWEFCYDCQLGKTEYKALYSRDVNNYIAFTNDKIKAKGAYANRDDAFYKLRSNPVNQICIDAAVTYLKNKQSIEHTIMGCRDIKKFITVRTVKGGAIKANRYLGKVIRWYRSCKELDAIYYAENENKVPKSDFGVPLMNLPDQLPTDIDYQWYIKEAKTILQDVGYTEDI